MEDSDALCTSTSLLVGRRDFAEELVLHFALDGRAFLHLGCTCKFWRDICREQRLWRQLLVKRYGASLTLPTDAALPVTVPGWTFVPGFDSGGSNIVHLANLSPAQLAAEAAQRNAVCFTTDGWIKRGVQQPQYWRHHTFEPGVGLYLQTDHVRMMDVQAREFITELSTVEPTLELPEYQGWTFYRGWESVGHDIEDPVRGNDGALWRDYEAPRDSFTPTCRSLAALAAAARARPQCVAFTTQGRLKHRLVPHRQWSNLQHTWHGMWVRNDVKASMQLPPPEAPPDYKAHYLRLARLRRYAASDCDITWLNGTYLKRLHEPTLGRHIVQLANVCWLDLSTSFQGVKPGRYQMRWRMRLDNRGIRVNEPYKMDVRVEVTRPMAEAQGPAPSSGTSAAARSAAGASTSAATEAPVAAVTNTAAADGADGADETGSDYYSDYDDAAHDMEVDPGEGGGSAAPGTATAAAGVSSTAAAPPAAATVTTLATAAASAAVLSVGDVLAELQLTSSLLQDLERAQGARTWFSLPVGQPFVLPGGCLYDVRVHFWSYSGDWKTGLSWDYAELVDLDDEEVTAQAVGDGDGGGTSDIGGLLRNPLGGILRAFWRRG